MKYRRCGSIPRSCVLRAPFGPTASGEGACSTCANADVPSTAADLSTAVPMDTDDGTGDGSFAPLSACGTPQHKKMRPTGADWETATPE